MYDSIVNSSEFLSDHWLAEGFPARLKVLGKQWSEQDEQGQQSIPKSLAGATNEYTLLKTDIPEPSSPDYATSATALNYLLLAAMGFDPEQQVLRTVHGDTEVDIPLLVRARVDGGEMLHVLQAGLVDSDDELLSGETTLIEPLLQGPDDEKPTAVADVASALQLLFLCDDAPRFALVVAGNWALLTDRERWAEGRYLAFDIQTALSRRDTKANGELAWHAGLWSADALLPDADGTARMADYSTDSVKHAVGVSADLREGLRLSVELIGNEVLLRRREKGLPVEGLDELPGEITAQSLRFLYRILFLLFAEARPELGILPVGAPE